jgi:hypothetical protein
VKQDYVRIPVALLEADRVFARDVFLYLPRNQKYVRLARRDATLDAAMLARLAADAGCVIYALGEPGDPADPAKFPLYATAAGEAGALSTPVVLVAGAESAEDGAPAPRAETTADETATSFAETAETTTAAKVTAAGLPDEESSRLASLEAEAEEENRVKAEGATEEDARRVRPLGEEPGTASVIAADSSEDTPARNFSPDREEEVVRIKFSADEAEATPLKTFPAGGGEEEAGTIVAPRKQKDPALDFSVDATPGVLDPEADALLAGVEESAAAPTGAEGTPDPFVENGATGAGRTNKTLQFLQGKGATKKAAAANGQADSSEKASEAGTLISAPGAADGGLPAIAVDLADAVARFDSHVAGTYDENLLRLRSDLDSAVTTFRSIADGESVSEEVLTDLENSLNATAFAAGTLQDSSNAKLASSAPALQAVLELAASAIESRRQAYGQRNVTPGDLMDLETWELSESSSAGNLPGVSREAIAYREMPLIAGRLATQLAVALGYGNIDYLADLALSTIAIFSKDAGATVDETGLTPLNRAVLEKSSAFVEGAFEDALWIIEFLQAYFQNPDCDRTIREFSRRTFDSTLAKLEANAGFAIDPTVTARWHQLVERGPTMTVLSASGKAAARATKSARSMISEIPLPSAEASPPAAS